MPEAQRDWSEYDRWAVALENVMFPTLERAQPVYLDLEEPKLAALAERMSIPIDKVESTLAAVVADSAELYSRRAFRPHRERLLGWQRQPEGPFPLLPLLAIFSLSAEHMTRGDGMAASNYYGRLAAFMGADRSRIEASYVGVADRFWSALNRWLDLLRGGRGSPTAFSVGTKRHIGLSISQALIREADRRRLTAFFSRFELPPRGDIPPSELEPLLDAWITQDRQEAGAHIAALWAKPQLQARVAEVVSVELAGWDGVDVAGEDSEVRARVLLALEMTRIPRKRLQVFPLFYGIDRRARDVAVETASGQNNARLEPLDDRAMILDVGGQVSDREALEGVLRVTDDAGQTYQRQPRRVVAFRRDESSARWLETKQVLLGDELIVLAVTEIAAQVEGRLEEISRPGWLANSDFPGVPEGWVCFSGVEVMGRPVTVAAGLSDLSALVPLTSKHMKLHGGISLGLRRWHSASPPEVTAVTDSLSEHEVFLLSVVEGDDELSEEVLNAWPLVDGSVVVDLGLLHLPDGEYAVQLNDTVRSEVTSRKEFSLRSGDSPDAISWERAAAVVHDASAPISIACADDVSEVTEMAIQGVLLAAGPAAEVPDAPVAPIPWWDYFPPDKHPVELGLARPQAGSCFYTGKHHEDLGRAEVDSKFRPVQAITVGRCRYCGIEHKYSSSYWRNRAKHERRMDIASGPASANRARVRPKAEARSAVPWDLALDCLRFFGGGDARVLESIAQQFDSGALFRSDFIRTLETLGHIEIRRDRDSLSLVNWEICASTIVDHDDVRSLIGFWNDPLRAVVRDEARKLGFEFQSVSRPDGPAFVFTTAPADLIASWVAGSLVARHPGFAMASHLRPLSELLSVLHRERRLPAIGVETFDPSHTTWRQATDAQQEGAYRVGTYSRKYFIRTGDDRKRGTIAIADVSLAKHAASILLAKRALVSFDPATRELVCPLGAELPGLYGRAVVLEAGQPPFRRGNLWVYANVSTELARRVTYLLEN